MRYRKRKFRSCPALTILEIIIALAIITIIFAVVLPQFRVILNGWDSRQAGTEVLQNGRILIDHINRNLSKAVKITAVEPNVYIQFLDNDSNTYQYDINPTSGYVRYGRVGYTPADLAGPVSSLTFTCYDACDIATADVNDIRYVEVETTVINSVSASQNKTLTTFAYLRTNAQGSDCWQNEDIGDVGAAGSASESDGTWTINGSGVDIWDYTDEFHYVYQPLSGDGQIIARVVSVGYTNAWAKAGVMIRETLDGDSKHAMMVVTPGNGTAFQRRTNTGGSSDHTEGSSVTAPYWVKLIRSGNTFTGYESADGSTWTLVGSVSITMATDVYIGLAVTSHSDGDLCTAEIDSVAFSTVEYEGFTYAKAGSDSASITIPTPGSVDVVNVLGSWVTGTNHAKEIGTNRALVFLVHTRGSGVTATGVSYGGQSMTKVVERMGGSGVNRAYVAAFILNDAGIDAASSTAFGLSWSGTAPTNVAYSSVFLGNVNQDALTGATGNATGTGSNVSTSPLATSDGDMVIVAAACNSAGEYTVNNGFTEALEFSVGSGDGVNGYKSATGVNETPSVTHDVAARQSLIGFVVNVNAAISGIEGDLLIAAVATDGSTTISPPSEEWTEINQGSYGSAVTLGAWWKLAEDWEPASHQFSWSGSGNQQAYGWMMHFTGHNSTYPINDYSTYGQSSIEPNSPAVNTTVDNCLILRLGAFDNDNITVNDPGLHSPIDHAPITMDKSATSFAVLLQDGFETDLSKWTTDWDRTTAEKCSGSYSVHCGSAQTTLTSGDMNTLGYSSIRIVLWYRDQGIDDGDNIFLQLYNGTAYANRFELGITSPELTWHQCDITINNSGGDMQYFRTNFRIRIDGTSIDSGENLWIDDVTVTVTLDGTVSGGAGYVGQASSGDSGTSTFALTSSSASQMLTIAIAPADINSCQGSVQP